MEFDTWYDINRERLRVYVYPTGVRYTVPDVKKLLVKRSGDHLLECEDGTRKIVVAGFIAVEIDSNDWDVI